MREQNNDTTTLETRFVSATPDAGTPHSSSIYIPRAERRQAGNHLVNDAAEGPQVRARRNALFGQQLRTDVLGRAHETVAPLSGAAVLVDHRLVRGVRLLQYLRTPEIGHFDVHVVVQQYVLRFQVPVHDVQVVQMLQRAEYFAGVETCAGRVERAHFVDVRQHVAVFSVGHNKVYEITLRKKSYMHDLRASARTHTVASFIFRGGGIFSSVIFFFF